MARSVSDLNKVVHRDSREPLEIENVLSSGRPLLSLLDPLASIRFLNFGSTSVILKVIT